MDRSGGVIADVPSTSGAAGARSGGEGGERGIRAKVEGCKVKINSWETEFAKAHGRKPTGDEVRADKQVYAMYREYRVLKAELEKENAAQTRGGAKPSAPDPRMQTSAPLRDVGSNAPRPSSRRPAADSSDDEDDEEVVEATPVKKAAIRSRPSQSQPGPPETRAGAPTLPVAASMPPSTSAPAIAKPEVKLPPRVASKPVGGMSSSVPSLARAGSGMHRRVPAIGGFARMAEQRKAAVETSSFEPLLCDSRGVLGSDVVTKAGAGSGGAKRSPDMTLSSLLEDDGKEKKKVPIIMPEPPRQPKEKRKAPPMPVYDIKPKRKAPERSIDEPDEDEMLAMMEAEERDAQPPMPADDGGEDLTAAEERAAARAAKKREEAVAKREARMAAEKTNDNEGSDGDDEDYSISDSDECAIAVVQPKRRRAAAPAKPRPSKAAPVPTAEPAKQMSARERADAHSAARNAAFEAELAKKEKKRTASRAKPLESADWRGAGDEAPEAPVPERKPAKRSKTAHGNFVKMNLNKRNTYKTKIKNGAKKTGANSRYGGGMRNWNTKERKRKAVPEPTENGQSVWQQGDWADRNAAKKVTEEDKRKAMEEAKAEHLNQAVGMKQSAAAIAAAEAREKLEKPSPELDAACAAALANPTEEALVDILRRVFGHSVFRPGQLEVIQRVLRGGSTLALLPTGAGKSLTYQLPAMLLPGLTLVVSPLLALMTDQLRGLPPALPGAALRSDQKPAQLFGTLDELRAGRLKVLFVSPERLLNERFLSDLRCVPGGVSLAVVDEAHCVSEWSHNFRPAYHRLGRILRSRLQLQGPVLALSATATARTERHLRSQLCIPKEGAYRNDTIRPNLTLAAMRVPANSRDPTLFYMLTKEPGYSEGSVIVYTAFQNQAETVAAYLQTKGVIAKAYHAGQEPKDRARTQAQFFGGSVRVVVATVAFGMGLDKPDIRAVINYSLPRSPEAYIQQAGRAGRDGQPARCVSFIDPQDFTRLRSLSFTDGVDRSTVLKLLEKVFLGKQKDAVAEGQQTVGALIVQKLERELDMRGEVIETVLSCLELWDDAEISRRCAATASEDGADGVEALEGDASNEGVGHLIRVLPDMRATCELRFHGKTPEQLATQCPLVAAVLQIGGKPKAGAYRFSVAEAARRMNDGLEEVSAQLQALSANGEAAYELTDRAVGYEILHPPPDLRQLAAALADHLARVEASTVEKLDTVYGALVAAADCEDDESQGASLRTSLEAYLGGDGAFHVPDLADVVSKEEPRRLRDDVRELLTTRSGGKTGGAGAMSARAVARVLHGLGSPAYPAQEWRRNDIGKRMWEKYVGTDFNLLVKVASEELLAMRGVVRQK